MGSFRLIDPKSWGFLRGISILQSIVKEPKKTELGLPSVSQLYVCRGHIFVVTDKGSLFAFDAVPISKLLTSSEEDRINEEVAKYLKDSSKEISLNSIVLLTKSSSPLIELVLSSSPSGTWLLGLSQSGILHVWRWDENSWRWIQIQKDDLNHEVPRSCKFFGYSTTHRLVVWSEDDEKFRTKSVTFVRGKKKGKNRYILTEIEGSEWQMEEGVTKKLPIELGDTIETFVGCRDGFWLITSHSFHFWSYITNTIHLYELEYDDPDSQTLKDIFKVVVHSVTQELVVLDSSGRVFVASAASGDKIRVSLVSTLEQFPSEDFTLIVHTHILGCLVQDVCLFFHLFTGKFLSEEPLPVDSNSLIRLWNTADVAGEGKAPAKIGVWVQGDGLFEVQLAAPIPSQFESVSTIGKQPMLDQEMILELCRQWKLDNLQSKFIMDLLLTNTLGSGKEGESVMVGSIADHHANLVESLLLNLQSPALVLPLLTKNPSSKRLITRKLQEFLSKYKNENQLTRSKSSGDLSVQHPSFTTGGALASYQYHTQLNQSIVPLLDQYLESSKKSSTSLSSNETTNVGLTKFIDSVQNVPVETILLLSRSTLEQFLRKEGDVIFNKFVTHFGLQTDKPTMEPFFHSEEKKNQQLPNGMRHKQHLLFEIMCGLYFQHEPASLSTFVTQVNQARIAQNPKSVSSLNDKTFFIRAFRVLPPADPSEDSVRTQARIKLLCLAEKYAQGVRLLLSLNKWKEALSILRDCTSNSVAQDLRSELFEILFTYTFKQKEYHHLQDLWAFVPPSVTILNLLNLVNRYRPYVDQTPNVVANQENEECPISLLLPQFLKMIPSTSEK